MNTPFLLRLAAVGLLAGLTIVGRAQDEGDSPPPAEPVPAEQADLPPPEAPDAAEFVPPAEPEFRPGEVEANETASSTSVSRPSRAPSATSQAAVAAASPTGLTGEGIRLNFKDAPLSQVLNYLSEAAGFVVVQDAPVTGNVTITSYQPLTQEETVDLLNAVLVDKGYAALRNGRILKIVSRSAARTMDLPVRSGADPELIPRKDELVTQIIPVRYAEAAKLIENIRPLLDEETTLTANESSNAIVLTDTLTNVRRIAEIIRALDTSIANISAIRVFMLEYADAKEVADVIKEVFSSSDSASSRSNGIRAAMEQRFRMMAGGRGGGGDAGTTGNSEARQAASRVVAVADEFTNALVVSAPDELIPTIEQIVRQLDTNIADITEVKVFRLEFADATELADVVNQLYYDQTSQSSQSSGRGGFGRGGAPASSAGQRSQRSLLQSRVVAVGDPRTNSLIITAARETMMSIAEMVGRLDASSDKKQKVFVVPLEHADVENVAEVLRGMFDDTGTSGSRSSSRNSNTGTSRLTQRANTGADTATQNFGTGNARNTGGGTTGR